MKCSTNGNKSCISPLYSFISAIIISSIQFKWILLDVCCEKHQICIFLADNTISPDKTFSFLHVENGDHRFSHASSWCRSAKAGIKCKFFRMHIDLALTKKDASQVFIISKPRIACISLNSWMPTEWIEEMNICIMPFLCSCLCSVCVCVCSFFFVFVCWKIFPHHASMHLYREFSFDLLPRHN